MPTYLSESSITDWLMVIVTIVYVITTIAIWFANKKSANATLAQIEESKRQFGETKRLEIMPYLEVEFSLRREGATGSLWIPFKGILCISDTDNAQKKEYEGHYMLKITNIGRGAVKNLKFKLISSLGTFDGGLFNLGTLQVGVQHEMYIKFWGATAEKHELDAKVQILFEFSDLAGNRYSQCTKLEFTSYSRSAIIEQYSTTDIEYILPKGEKND